MKINFIFIVLLFATIYAKGQGICNDVIASTGNFENGGSGSIAWTLGEPVSETVSSANNSVTQGFLQTDCCPVIIFTETNEIRSMLVYPNPASQKITIDFGKPMEEQYKITLTDLHGRILVADKFYRGGEASTYRLDLSRYVSNY